MHIYSIKNEKLNFFNRPIYTESFNEALSYLQNVLMSDADRALIGLKDDLALYFLGEIDFTTGVITALEKPKKICDLREIFDSIPDDKVPQTANALHRMIDELAKRVYDLENPPEDVSDADRTLIDELAKRVYDLENPHKNPCPKSRRKSRRISSEEVSADDVCESE